MSDSTGGLPPTVDSPASPLEQLTEAVLALDENVTSHSAGVEMLRAEVAETQTRASLIANQVRLDRSRAKSERRRFYTLLVVMTVAMLGVFVIGASNRYYNQVLVNCTTPGHKCYDDAQKQTGKIVAAITDTNANGVADNLEVLAAVQGQPPPTAPTTTTTQPRQVVTVNDEIGWQIYMLIGLLGIGLLGLFALQIRPEWFKREKQPKRRADDVREDDFDFLPPLEPHEPKTLPPET